MATAKKQKAEEETAMEFGGPLGAAIGFIALPVMVYYLWICARFYHGLAYPQELSIEGFKLFGRTMVDHVLDDGLPTVRTTVLYVGWVFFQAILAVVCPGKIVKGAVLSDGKTQLDYLCNGLCTWWITLATVLSLHLTGYFRLSELADCYAPLMTTASVFATVLSVLCWTSAHMNGRTERMTGNLVYDFFMGAELNPRLGKLFDIKMFVEIRPGIKLWFLLTAGFAMKQYELHGAVSSPMLCLCLFHFVYANSCFKGEECIPRSMDIIYEKFGWMLCWANLVWVPFTYCVPSLYLLHTAPFEPSLWYTGAVLAIYALGYWIFDDANAQKDLFRLDPNYLIWGREKPKFLQTKRGTKLLISGFWGVSRHINYLGDILQAWCFGLVCTFGSVIPYFYAVYLTALLIHRERRDNYDCQRKYGDDWEKYCKLVPARIVPFLY